MPRRIVQLQFLQFVSIPMTVLGGLQFNVWLKSAYEDGGFNTDDGIRRAAIS